jgi:hypothetical protein
MARKKKPSLSAFAENLLREVGDSQSAPEALAAVYAAAKVTNGEMSPNKARRVRLGVRKIVEGGHGR